MKRRRCLLGTRERCGFTDMPIDVNQFAGALPSGNFFSDPRLPPNVQSSGSRYTPGGGGSPVGGGPALPDFSEISNLIGQINATNQAAQQSANAGRIPNAPQLEGYRSSAIADLLNPQEQIGEIDTGAAAAALGSGTSGSPFAGHMGILLNENERIRRQGLGSNMLNQAYAGNPSAPIADTQQLLQFIQQQRFQAQQNALNRGLEAQLAFMRNNRSYGPHLPTGYGNYGRGSGSGGPFGANIPSGVDPYYNPEDYSGAYNLPDISYSSDVVPTPALYDLPDFSMEDYSAYA